MMAVDLSENVAPTEKEILAATRLRMEMLRPLVAEHDRLAAADKALEKAMKK